MSNNPYKSPLVETHPTSSGDSPSIDNELAAKRFRWLLILWIVIGVAGLPVSIVADSFLPPALLAYESAQLQGLFTTLDDVTFVIEMLFIPLLIWNLVQLYRLKASARRWAIALTIAGLPMYFMIGPSIESPMSQVYTGTTSMLWGALLAVMYCYPYSEQFK